MGKRKERRLAAMASANRRVKLDLFVEPAGEMMSTSAHDEVGGDLDQERAGVPTSPSSSGGYCCLLGQKQENPLLLLGQYSDEEVDEENSKQPRVAADENNLTDPDGQEPTSAGVSVGGKIENDLSNSNNEQELDLVDTVENADTNDDKEIVRTYESAQYSDAVPAAPSNIPEPSGIQVDGDLAGGWKVVMHEESHRYYYWNTVTGETSWEVPTVLANEHAVPSDTEGAGCHVDVHASAHANAESLAYAYVSSVAGLGVSSLISKEVGEYGSVLDLENRNTEVTHLAYDANQSLTQYSAVASAPSDFVPSQQSMGVTMDQMTIPGEHNISGDETADVHSASLVKYSESLLQRLEVLHRSGNCLEKHEFVVKEIEIRLSDCKALCSYGSSLLPFWWHTEAQLKQLESVISSREASLLVHSKHNGNLDTSEETSLRDESLYNIRTGSEVIQDKGTPCTVENGDPSITGDASKPEIEASSQVPYREDNKIYNQLLGSEQELEIVPESNPNTLPVQLEPRLESHAEDVDMDVEMEVDEETPVVQASAGMPSSVCPVLQQLVQPNQPSPECPSGPSDEPSVPPPPEEEWIPPPPPDTELVPPPPPDEPEPSVPPPPYVESTQCPPYPDQYNLSYTVPAYDYYTPTVGEITNGNYYAQAEGSHITTDAQAPSYYEPVVANALPEGAVNNVNSVQPVAYYDVSSGTVLPPVPVVGSMESSGYYTESGSINYLGTVPASDHTVSVGISMESGSNSLPTESSSLPMTNLKPDTSATVTEPQTSILHSASVASTVQTVATVLMNGSDVKVPPSTAPRNQTKVARSKKRTVVAAPALRSNKKVSSLVDKWKAAKEELHGDEDEEPENAYEVLEKKRQKEIEEWRARQIASGEAQDNANFLPLGGDWRERVKRRRAEAKTEAAQTPSESVDNERRQPDLVELSKDLPSGWQAYWDESTKEVYYGNSITSETTWTRPSR